MAATLSLVALHAGAATITAEHTDEGWAPYTATEGAASAPTEPLTTVAPRTAGELLSQAHGLYLAQDYQGCVALSQAVLDAADASAETRLDAYQLQGGALAMIGDAAGSEMAFGHLLQGRPGFSLSQDAPAAVRDALEAARAHRAGAADAASAPATAQPVAAESSLYENPWFWGVTAAAVVLASVAAGGIVYTLMTRPPESDLPPVAVP